MLSTKPLLFGASMPPAVARVNMFTMLTPIPGWGRAGGMGAPKTPIQFKPIPAVQDTMYREDMYQGAIDAMHLLAKSQIAAALINQGWDPTVPGSIVQPVNRIFDELKGG